MKRKLKSIPLFIVACVIVSVGIDFVRISTYTTHPLGPPHQLHLQQDQIYYELANGEQDIDWSRLDGTLEFINHEYDCSDFRLVNLIRILHEYGDRIPETTRSAIDTTLLAFRYWWDEPGENSMCYWSENHQILFASAEYLVGQIYPDTVFPNSLLTGPDHMIKARKRILGFR